MKKRTAEFALIISFLLFSVIVDKAVSSIEIEPIQTNENRGVIPSVKAPAPVKRWVQFELPSELPKSFTVKWDGKRINPRKGVMTTSGVHEMKIAQKGRPTMTQKVYVRKSQPTVIRLGEKEEVKSEESSQTETR